MEAGAIQSSSGRPRLLNSGSDVLHEDINNGRRSLPANKLSVRTSDQPTLQAKATGPVR